MPAIKAMEFRYHANFAGSTVPVRRILFQTVILRIKTHNSKRMKNLY